MLTIDQSDVLAVRTEAAAGGVAVKQISRRGIEPGSTVTLVLVGQAAAVAGVQQVLDRRKGGQVIDLTPDAPEMFYRTTKVPYGTVIIMAVDGKVTITIANPDGMFGRVTSSLPQLLIGCGDAQQVVEVATKTFGHDVRTETEVLAKGR